MSRRQVALAFHNDVLFLSNKIPPYHDHLQWFIFFVPECLRHLPITLAKQLTKKADVTTGQIILGVKEAGAPLKSLL